jgi:outer membrane immunogenic protein
MKRFVLAGVLAFAAGSQAFAADLPQPSAPPQAPVAYLPVAPPYNWGGVYFGVNGGYGFGKSKVSDAAASTGTFNTSGYVAGGTLGANFQSDAFVFGLEGDIDATGIKGTSSAACGPPVACETKNTWLSTLRARVGFAADRVLFYGTAGGAFGNIEAANVTGGFLSSTKGGWTAGAGVEAAFADNWTARLEYLYVDLQNASFTSTVPSGTVTSTFQTSMVRFGVDYKFR